MNQTPEIRTKLVDKNVYVKWYNFAKELINNDYLIPSRTDKEIKDLVSQMNWLLFCPKGEEKVTMIMGETPNVFLDILSHEGNLIGEARIGLTFNNLSSYKKFQTIMRGANRELKEKITKKLLALDDSWKIKVTRKIKKNYHFQTPDYTIEKEWKSNEINEGIIGGIITIGDAIIRQGIEEREKLRMKCGNPKKFYSETPSIELMESTFHITKKEFSKRIEQAFDILSDCYQVKSNVEIRKKGRDLSEKLSDKETELNIEKKKEKMLELMKGLKMPDFKEENLIECRQNIDRLILEIEQINLEIEGLKDYV